MHLFLFLLVASMAVLGCSNSSNDPIEGNSSSSNYEALSSDGNSSPSDEISSSDGNSSPGEEISSSSGSSSPSGNGSSSSGASSSSGSSSPSGNVSSSSAPIPTPEAYYEKLTTANAQKGWGSRYWDGCKPHCSQRDNVDLDAVPFTVCRNCDKNNKEIPAFTLSPDIEVRYESHTGNIVEDWIGYKETVNSCQSGGIAYACWDMAPIALNDTLAYAFMATSLNNASCGQCFQLQFDGGNHANDVKEAHKLLEGKTLIVMATNTGSDVDAGQFDIMIPGGGPGIFDSFAEQIGVNTNQLGENSGGLLTTCQRKINDYDKPAKDFQECVREKCNDVFDKDKHPELLNGCLWFVDWFKTADNPTYLYKKIDCPKYFVDKYPSTINTSPNNKFEPYGGFNKNIPEGYEYTKWTW